MKKINVVILFIFAFFIAFSSIYAYNLQIQSYEKDDFVQFYTIVKASQNSINNFGNHVYGEDFISVDQTNFGRKQTSYDVVGILFHKEQLSNYTQEGKAGYYETVEESVEYQDDGITKVSKFSYSYLNYTTANTYNVAYADSYGSKINLSEDYEKSKEELNKYLSSSTPTGPYRITSNVNVTGTKERKLGILFC